jgi:hypothetical protein
MNQPTDPNAKDAAPAEAAPHNGARGKPPPNERKLKLRAVDNEDLQVLASFLQDSLAPVSDMAYDPASATFTLVVNRFRWECEPAIEKGECFERILCGLHFAHVTAVKRRNIDLAKRGAMLDLLHMEWDGARVVLAFAGDKAIALEAPRLECRMQDFGEPWPAARAPAHE